MKTYIKNIKSFYRNNYSCLTMLKYTTRFVLCNVFGKKYTK